MHQAGPRPDGLAVGAGGVAGEVTCRQFVELITEYLECALAEEAVSQVDGHLLVCAGCGTYLAQMRATIVALRALRAA